MELRARSVGELFHKMVKYHIMSPETRDCSQLLQWRLHLIQDRRRVINRIQNLTSQHDIMIDASKAYSEETLSSVQGRSSLLPNNEKRHLLQCIRHIRYLNGEIKLVEKEITIPATKSSEVKLLISMTGVDYFTALFLAVEIDGVERFPTAKKLTSWAGLAPNASQSNDRTIHRRLKRYYNKRVRWVMIEVANVAIQCDERMGAFYKSSMARNGDIHPLAIIRVANKILNIIWHILTFGEPYSTHSKEIYARELAIYEKHIAAKSQHV